MATTNYYDDSGPDESAGPSNKDSPEQAEERKDREKTALIPSSLCPGMDIGDEVVLKIVGVHEEEYEVAYSPKKDKEEGEGKEEPSMARASESNESMSHGGGMGSYYD